MAKSSAEREAREKLALCGRSLYKIGVYGLGGHISLRIPDSDLILITPGGGLDKERLTADDLVTMDARGNRVAGPYPPPLETPIHTVVHAARPELASVAHLHPHWSTIFGIANRPLDIVLLPASSLGPVPTFDIPSLVTTDELGHKLNAALGDACAVLMRWHGSTVVGNTLEEMFDRALFMEENARLLWEASLIGTPIPVPAEAVQAQRSRPEVVPGARTLNYYANLERSREEQVHQTR